MIHLSPHGQNSLQAAEILGHVDQIAQTIDWMDICAQAAFAFYIHHANMGRLRKKTSPTLRAGLLVASDMIGLFERYFSATKAKGFHQWSGYTSFDMGLAK